MTKSATNWRGVSTMIQDARVGHTLDPEVFASFALNHLAELDGHAGVPDGTSANEPENPKVQGYMRRSLRVIEELTWLGFDLDRALFWFRNFPISPLDGTPLALMANDCLEIVLAQLNRTFGVHNQSLGKIWERVREDTILAQEALVRRVPMYQAFQVARICAPTRVLDNEFLVARDLSKAGTMFHVMWHRKPLFPKYQFAATGPLPIIERILRVLSPHCSSWDIALWCSQSNGWLSGRHPEELLESDPQRVIEAAEQEVVER